jgi:hypothetical protein
VDGGDTAAFGEEGGGNKMKRISQLSPEQCQHLARLLDQKTDINLLTIIAITRGEDGDRELTEVFEGAGMTPHRAKIYARKVIDLS